MAEQEEWENAVLDINKKSKFPDKNPLSRIKSREIVNQNTDNSSTPVGSDLSSPIRQDEIPVDPALLSALEQPREKLNLLKFEDKIVRFMKSPKEQQLEFPPLSGFHRLLVHRLAIRFGLEHQAIEVMLSSISMAQQGGAYEIGSRDLCPMVISKTKHCEIPKPLLIDIVSPMIETPNYQSSTSGGQSSNNAGKKIMLMKRDPKGSSQPVSKESQKGKAKQMSVAEKEKAYAAARARIFGTEEGNSICLDDNSWVEKNLESEKSSLKKAGKNPTRSKISSGPDGTIGFSTDRGKSLETKRNPESQSKKEKPPEMSTMNVDKEQKAGAKSKEAVNRKMSKEKKKQVVNAGEWLKDGKVKARRRAENNCDPDFQRNYDVYRPNFAPYRESPPPMMENVAQIISPLPPWVAEGQSFASGNSCMGMNSRYMSASNQVPQQQQQQYFYNNSSMYQPHPQQGRGQANESDFYANQMAHHQAVQQQQQLQPQMNYYSPTTQSRYMSGAEYNANRDPSYGRQTGEMHQSGRLPNSSYNEHFPALS